MKKIYKVIMLTVMFICLFSVTAIADEEGESVYIYSVNADGKTITINEYNGSSSELDIPSSIDGMQVTAIGDEAFSYNSYICKLKIPYGVKQIGKRAFASISELQEITIPYSVTSIGDEAFEYCGLLQINIPSSVREIGSGVFAGCGNVNSIIVDESNLFYDSRNNCNAIIRKSDNVLISGCKNSSIPLGITAIGKRAFKCVEDLTEITLPVSVTRIEAAAFQASGLENIILPDNLTYIGDEAFYSCNIEEVVLPQSVTEIGSGVFTNCAKLESITLSENLSVIGVGAFSRCDELKSLYIPASVTNIKGAITTSDFSLTSIKVSSANKKYDSRNNCNSIVETKSNKIISACRASIIPESIKRIGESAFEGVHMDKIVIPDSVTYIDDYAFAYSILSEITLSENVLQIGESAFGGCWCLKKIVIKNYSMHIGRNAFDNMPVWVEGRCYYCYQGSTAQKYADEAADGVCKFMTRPSHSINITDKSANTTITGIGNRIFTGNEIKQTGIVVTVCGKKLSLGSDYTLKYENNKNIGKAKIVITGKGNYAGSITKYFDIKIVLGGTYKVGSLKYKITNASLNGKGTMTLLGSTYKNSNKKFNTLTIGDAVVIGGKRFKVTSIAPKAFSNRKYLKKVVIGSNIQQIGSKAFYGCTSINTVVIGKNVRIIGSQSFANCRGLKKIVIKTSFLKSSSVGKSAFSNIFKKANIKVPVKKKNAYIKILRSKGVSRQSRITK